MTRTLVDLFTFAPERIGPSLVFWAGIMILCELARISLAVAFTRSVAVHLLVNLLTVVIQPVALAAALVASIAMRPELAGRSFLYALGLYAVWYAAGQATLLIRPDSQGADPGFISVGAIITFAAGGVAVLLYA